MSHSHSNSKALKLIIILILVALCAFSVAIFLFFNSTIASVDEYCQTNSFKNATAFDIQSKDELPNYVFAVSQGGDSVAKGQELFIFEEKPFGIIKNTNRFVLAYHTNQDEYTDIGAYTFKPFNQNESYLIFYSDNKIGAENGYCITNYNENAKDIKTQITYSVSPSQPFILISNPIKANESVESAYFEDGGKNIIYKY